MILVYAFTLIFLFIVSLCAIEGSFRCLSLGFMNSNVKFIFICHLLYFLTSHTLPLCSPDLLVFHAILKFMFLFKPLAVFANSPDPTDYTLASSTVYLLCLILLLYEEDASKLHFIFRNYHIF